MSRGDGLEKGEERKFVVVEVVAVVVVVVERIRGEGWMEVRKQERKRRRR